MSGGSVAAMPLWPSVGLACVVAAVDFAVLDRYGVGLVAVVLLLLPLLLWRAALALRAMDPFLHDQRIDRAAARARFRRVPVAAALFCLVLGLGVPLFANWSGFDGAVMSMRGRRLIEHASQPALFCVTTACWFAVSATLLWFGIVFGWTIERIRRDPRSYLELAQR